MSRQISDAGQVEIVNALHAVGERAMDDGRFDDTLGCLEIIEHLVETYQADPEKQKQMLKVCKSLAKIMEPLLALAVCSMDPRKKETR